MRQGFKSFEFLETINNITDIRIYSSEPEKKKAWQIRINTYETPAPIYNGYKIMETVDILLPGG